MALVGAAQPLLMAWLYRRRLSHTGWAPESQQDVAALLFAAVGSSLLLALLGGFPTLDPSDLPHRGSCGGGCCATRCSASSAA